MRISSEGMMVYEDFQHQTEEFEYFEYEYLTGENFRISSNKPKNIYAFSVLTHQEGGEAVLELEFVYSWIPIFF